MTRWSGARLIRPYAPTLPNMPGPFVIGPEDQAPEGATAPVLATCDRCAAAALVVFRRVVLLIPDGWIVALPFVRELQFCGHHARRYEATLRGWDTDEIGPWVAVLDARPVVADHG